MTFLLSPCVLWISTSISFLSADSNITVSVRLNSTVLLPCQFTRDSSKTPHIVWQTPFKIVFERQGEGFYQDKVYKDRVDVPEDELVQGNCSLVLQNIRATDANIYKSYMMVTDTNRSDKLDLVQNVELRVDETPKSDKETPKEHLPRTNNAGINSLNTLIIISVVTCIWIAPLAIIAIEIQGGGTSAKHQIKLH